MSTNPILPFSAYDSEYAASSTPLIDHPKTTAPPSGQRWSVKYLASIFISTILFVLLILIIVNQVQEPHGRRVDIDGGDMERKVSPEVLTPPSRGVPHGVSEKAFREGSGGNVPYPWTNSMLSWQNTSYHFQPGKNWMNDPNGPLFHMGWYHFFYQYNPNSAIWGNISWGHAVSKDLIHWLHLPLAMVPDCLFDINGVYTGSATILPDGQIIMLYTGDSKKLVQVQNLAYPKNLSDPLLLEWIKYPSNPVIVPPPGIGLQDFRDPTTAWLGPNGKWLITIGSKINKDGIALVYETTNFTSFKLLDGILHGVNGTGMWECVDFYPISMVHTNGLDTSTNGPNIKHVLKASTDSDGHDYYAIGTYDPIKIKWIPDNEELDVGIGLRLDYGEFYASKTFYDHHKQRRILWGWTGETDSELDDLLKGWASLQTIPRTIVFDNKTGSNILQWPVEEIENLRIGSTEFDGIKLEPGSIVPLKIKSGAQLDIIASFKVDEQEALRTTLETNVGYNCKTSGGSASRGYFGPFGIAVVADENMTELTPIYFYIAKTKHGKTETHFCADGLRSSLAFGVGKEVYGSKVPVLDGEDFTMRVLIDHSIVESFAQGGRTVITSRIYPTKAINEAAQIFLINNSTGISVTASVKIWNMDSADIHKFPLN